MSEEKCEVVEKESNGAYCARRQDASSTQENELDSDKRLQMNMPNRYTSDAAEYVVSSS